MDAVLQTCLLAVALSTPAATVQTRNFTVNAPTDEFAQQVGEAAEYYRRELSLTWTGREMPPWNSRCPIFVKVGDYGAGGATSFNFDRGEVYGWKMNVQGSAERILDSVLPHEVNHTIFACYFRRPLPRWADEGAASLIEHESERMRLKKIHEEVMHSTRKIPLRKLLPMKQYPTDERQVLTLYAEGYSLADFLIQQSSKQEYLEFLTTALKAGWEKAFQQHYRYESLEDLERDLDKWVVAGSPELASPDGMQLALGGLAPRPEPVIRAQSPDVFVELGKPGEWPTRATTVAQTSAARPTRSRNELDRPVVRQAAAESTGRSRRDLLVQPALHVAADKPLKTAGLNPAP
ncbi:MAG TPA: hypothetical protein VM165_09330 [Planctomycetaceae bacterium]|nr:hypothetical protein [Planctomycetaceae bacterium]